MTSAPTADIALTSSKNLVWYRSSQTAERGFCADCGGNLFWRQFGDDMTSITAGTLDTPTNLRVQQHIFVGSKSDYYMIDDPAPQQDQWL